MNRDNIQDDKKMRSEKGYSNLSYLLTLLGLLTVIFLGSQIMPFYYSYYELLGTMKAQAVKGDDLSDRLITENIARTIRKQGMPASIEDLKINRFDNRIIIEIHYEEILYVDFGHGYDWDLWVFHFNPRTEFKFG